MTGRPRGWDPDVPLSQVLNGPQEDWRSRVVSRSVGPAADRTIQRGQSLLSAASHLIHRGEGDDITMQKVADEAGVSLRVLYQHFASKDDLLVALIEESQANFVVMLRRYVAKWDEPLDRLGAAMSFATDRRLHTRASFNTAMARFTTHISITSPDDLGRARRPLFDLFTELVTAAAAAGMLEVADPEVATASVMLAYANYQTNSYLGNSTGVPLPSSADFTRFCLTALGVKVEPDWFDRFRLTDEEAEPYRTQADRISGGHEAGH